MTVLIRVDASVEIGTGHVARCAALAQMAISRGHSAKMLSSGIDNGLLNWLQGQGLSVVHCPIELVSDADWTSRFARDLRSSDWLVVDHYGLDASWEMSVDRGAGRLLVVDDLANRSHVCDALLDVGMHTLEGSPYAGLLGPDTKCLFGPGYALVREEFDNEKPRERSGVISRVLVFLGGGGNTGVALHKIARALESRDLREVSVVFLANPTDLCQISMSLERNPNFTATSPMVDVLPLLQWADLVIGTCGTSTWERLLLGVPALCVITAENQRSDAELLDSVGAIVNLGDCNDLKVSDVRGAITELVDDSNATRAISAAGLRVMEGRADAKTQLLGLIDSPS